MPIRIVVADESCARFYELTHRHDLQPPAQPLALLGELSDPVAHLHDRDLKSDRPGRKNDHAPLQNGRRGAAAHHGVGSEAHPRRRQAQQFARRIVTELTRSHERDPIEKLVLIAGPRFLGLLRAALPERLRALVADEIHSDLVHAPDTALREHLAAELAAGRL